MVRREAKARIAEPWKWRCYTWRPTARSMYLLVLILSLSIAFITLLSLASLLAPLRFPGTLSLLQREDHWPSYPIIHHKTAITNRVKRPLLVDGERLLVTEHAQNISADVLVVQNSSQKYSHWKEHENVPYGAKENSSRPQNVVRNITEEKWNAPLQISKDVFSTIVNATHRVLLDEPYVRKILKRVCGESDRDEVELVILILSDVLGFERRQAVRDTWLSPYAQPASQVKHFFLIGHKVTMSEEVVRQLRQEMDAHLDVVQVKIDDSYAYLTFKTLLGLKLIATFCARARHVLKTDHDVWVNMPSLMTSLNQNPISPPTGVEGHCGFNRQPLRDPKSKYYISRVLYPSDTYPAYCNGPGYVTTPWIAHQIVAVSPVVPFLPLEDVYVALCLRALGLQVRHIRGFGFWRGANVSTVLSDFCQYHNHTVIVRHAFTPEELRNIWRAGRCPDLSDSTRSQSKPWRVA